MGGGGGGRVEGKRPKGRVHQSGQWQHFMVIKKLVTSERDLHCLRNDSVFLCTYESSACLIWGRKPSVSMLQIIYIIDFQTSLKEIGIYHPNCGRWSVCLCHFI